METITLRDARRLALARAGLLKPEWTGLPARAGRDPRAAANAAIRASGYLQLDTISISGARSHAIVLHSRLPEFDASLGEELLQPGEPLFEHWGHAACWLPLELYPLFGFRREDFRANSEFHEILEANPGLAEAVLAKVRDEGPLRSVELEAGGVEGRWGAKPSRYAAMGLWMTGDLAIRERRKFQRVYDLPERVIPAKLRRKKVSRADAIRELTRLALRGHGWAGRKTLSDTWYFHRGNLAQLDVALRELTESGEAVPCNLRGEDGEEFPGWIRPVDLELAARLRRVRPGPDRGVLLSPFDPVLWDRARVRLLFGFEQVLEIYKPAKQRVYGYYVLPVLAGEHLVARVDLKADRKKGRLHTLSCHYESPKRKGAKAAVQSALERFAECVSLTPA